MQKKEENQEVENQNPKKQVDTEKGKEVTEKRKVKKKAKKLSDTSERIKKLKKILFIMLISVLFFLGFFGCSFLKDLASKEHYVKHDKITHQYAKCNPCGYIALGTECRKKHHGES